MQLSPINSPMIVASWMKCPRPCHLSFSGIDLNKHNDTLNAVIVLHLLSSISETSQSSWVWHNAFRVSFADETAVSERTHLIHPVFVLLWQTSHSSQSPPSAEGQQTFKKRISWQRSEQVGSKSLDRSHCDRSPPPQEKVQWYNTSSQSQSSPREAK